MFLGFTDQELETVFKILCQSETISQKKVLELTHGLPTDSFSFTYKHFVKLLSMNKNKTYTEESFAKLHNNFANKKLSWKTVFTGFKGGKAKMKNSNEILLQDLKILLKSLHLGLNQEEIDLIINAFDIEPVTYWQLEKRCLEGASKIDEMYKDKNVMIFSLLHELQAAITREHVELSRIFFDFDENQNGTLSLKEFTKLVYFLKINCSKQQIKTFFDTIDFERKGYITLSEFKTFMEESTFYKKISEKAEISNIEHEHIISMLKDSLQRNKKSLVGLIAESNLNENFSMTESSLTKLLENVGSPLKNEEIKTLIKKVQEFSNEISVTFQNLLEFAAKEHIEKSASLIKPGKKVAEPIKIDEEQIMLKIKEALTENNTSLQKGLNKIELNANYALTAKNLEKLLTSIGAVLHRNELAFLVHKLQETLGEKALKFQDFIDFAIRERIEVLEFEETEMGYIHPTVAMCIDQMQQLFRKLEITPQQALSSLRKPTKRFVTKKDFLKMLQAMELNFTHDDLLLLYQYFDEKGFGEISSETFLEKFETLAYINLSKLQRDEMQENEAPQKNSRISLKQQIFIYMQEKHYNKKQIVSVFDKNGNGKLSHAEFVEGLKLLGLEVPLEKCRILSSYIDKSDSGIIDIDDFVSMLYQSLPSTTKSSYRYSQVMNLFSNIVERLKHNATSFVEELVTFEKFVRFSDTVDFGIVGRNKTGVYMLDFFRLLKEFGIALEEDEKQLIRDMFMLRQNNVYDTLEGIILEKHNPNVVPFDSDGSHPYWEEQVYRTIGEYLKKNNLTIEKAFNYADTDRSGHISTREFTRLLESIDMPLNKKEINKLLASYNAKGYIFLEEFKNKFWSAYASFGKNIAAKQLKLRIEDLQLNKKKLIGFILNTLKEKCKDSVEACWRRLDLRRVGLIAQEDLRNAFIKLEIYITKNDLSSVFNFIDTNQDGLINFLELVDFWQWNPLIVDKKTEIQNDSMKMQTEILEYICKILNQKEISLWEIFEAFDSDQKGFINQKDFTNFLEKIGLNLKENSVEQIMRMIDNNDQKVIHFTILEGKLMKNGYSVKKESQVTRIEWADKGINRLIKSINTVVKGENNYFDYFSKFDSDFDGWLKINEFANSIKFADPSIPNNEIQRISHVVMDKRTNILDYCKISIETLSKFLENANQKLKNRGELFKDIVSVSFDVFGYILNNFDGFENLFRISSSTRKSLANFKNYKQSSRKNIRSLRLYGHQKSFEDIKTKIFRNESSLIKVLNQIKNLSREYINNLTATEYLNPKLNTCVPEIQLLRKSEVDIINANVFELADNSSFSVDLNSVNYITPFIKSYKGYFFREDKPAEIFVYPKDTLVTHCSDGNLVEKHLNFELQVHNALREKGDFIFKNLAKYEKKIGVESVEKEIFVLNEEINDKEFISFAKLIELNGGLLRIPFLTKTNAVNYIIRFWGSEILKILHQINNLGCVKMLLRPENVYIRRDGMQIKLGNLRGIGKVNEFGKVCQGPNFEINLEPPQKDKENSFLPPDTKQNLEKLLNDPYLAPEMVFKPILELSPKIDSWAFGALLYNILFGKPPVSYYNSLIKFYPELKNSLDSFSKPSDYYLFDLFPEDFIQNIYKIDYSINLPKSDPLTKAIAEKSYGYLFEPIFGENCKEIGEVLNIISLCMEFDSFKRPTIDGLFSSRVFKQDNYQFMLSKQFSECMFFYRSPDLNLREKVLIHLRQICLETIKKPKTILKYVDPLLKMMDLICECVLERTSKRLEDLKKSISLDKVEKNPRRITEKLPNQMQTQIEKTQHLRNKLPNYVLVKFLIEQKILDHLVFLILRHHTFYNNMASSKKISPKNETENDSWRLLTSLKDIFKFLFFELTEYTTAVAPFVGEILTVFTKLFLGEEFALGSDIIMQLDRNWDLKTKENLFSEYTEKNLIVHKRFFTYEEIKPDSLDELWSAKAINKPFIFTSLHWTSEIYAILSNLYKDAITESGFGKTSYKVLQDYIRFCTTTHSFSEYNIHEKQQRINSDIKQELPKGADYYNDLMTAAENLDVLTKMDSGRSTLKIVINFIKSMLMSQNTDKIKLILDSKLPLYLIPFLNHEDPQIRGDILEVFYEISTAFVFTDYSYMFESEHSILKNASEATKVLGIVAHINTTNEDKIDQKRFVECANDYFFLNSQINKKYLKQIALIFSSPAIISPLFLPLKTQAELVQNKKFVLKIFKNLLDSPAFVIKNLSSCTMDVFSTVFKILVKRQSGVHQRHNKELKPIVIEIYQKIAKNCRSEILEIMETTQGMRSMLKEENLSLPQKLNINMLGKRLENLKAYYNYRHENIILETKGMLLNKTIPKHFSDNAPTLKELHFTVIHLADNLISWFNYYFLENKSILIESKILVHIFCEITETILEDLLRYGFLNLIVSEILLTLTNFYEVISNMNLDYLLFDEENEKSSVKRIKWMMKIIEKINSYHLDIDYNDNEKDLEELKEKKMLNTLHDIDEKNEKQLKMLLENETLKKYSKNTLIPIIHSFQRIFLKLIDSSNHFYDNLLNKCGFAFFYSRITKQQYNLLSLYIKTKTEDIHLLSNYVSEANIRISLFESILKGNNEILKEELIQLEFVQSICGVYLRNVQEYDVKRYIAEINFVAFRNFLPFRNEALAMITSIIWHKEKSIRIFNDFLVGIGKFHLIKEEMERLMRFAINEKMYITSYNKELQPVKLPLEVLTALYFFSLIVYSADEQMLFMMKHEKVFEHIEIVFKFEPKLHKEFRILSTKLKEI